MSARDQYHGRWVGTHGELLGDREPIDAGELDVQHDDTGPEAGHGLHRPGTVRGLAGDVEALCLERALAERRKSAWTSTMSTLIRLAPTLTPRRAVRIVASSNP
jgi:hypothetical protein